MKTTVKMMIAAAFSSLLKAGVMYAGDLCIECHQQISPDHDRDKGFS